MRRLYIVYNPQSSQYVHVKDEVLSRIDEARGFMVGKFQIRKVGFEKNVARLVEILEEGDIVVAAGGDATAAICANAIILSGKRDILFAALPYGNFNDLARTLKLSRIDDVFKVILRFAEGGKKTCGHDAESCGHDLKTREHDSKTCPHVRKLYPLEILVDGERWRYATCYLTMGMTAESVELFDEPKFRAKMQEGHRSSWRSYVKLAEWYFKNRRKKRFLPEFTVNGVSSRKDASDYAAVNGRSMSRVMRGGEDYLDSVVFRSETEKTVNFLRLCVLMIKSMFARVPGEETKGDVVKFKEPATVSMQAEGEYATFRDVSRVEIRKSRKIYLNIIEGGK